MEGELKSRAAVDVFWGEIAPCAHMVQMYENVDVLIDSLDGFIGGGLESGDAAIVIATPVHLMLLNHRLEARGIDVEAARESDQYIALDAEESLATFMLGGWPDPQRFEAAVTQMLKRARRDGRKVRAFGEMVAVLWARGEHGAVVRLEQLWQSFCQRSPDMCLFCAFPKAGFTKDTSTAVAEICAAHSLVFEKTPRAH